MVFWFGYPVSNFYKFYLQLSYLDDFRLINKTQKLTLLNGYISNKSYWMLLLVLYSTLLQ